MKHYADKIEKITKNLKLSLIDKKRLSNIPSDYGFYFAVGMVVVLVAVFGAFQLRFEKKDVVIDSPVIIASYEEIEIVPDFIIEKKIPEALIEQVDRIHIQELTVIEVVDDDEDVLPTVIYDSSVIVERVPRVSDIKVEVEEVEVEPIPIYLVSDLPIFPGCEKFSIKKQQFDCLSKNITKHVIENFDTEIAIQYGIEVRQKALVTFVINTKGVVVNVKARAPHPELQKEVISVVSSLPKMKPAQQGFKKVSVSYALPVVLQVE